MKTLDEILRNPRVELCDSDLHNEGCAMRYRVVGGSVLFIVMSTGTGWDHVSVRVVKPNPGIPSWMQMNAAKRLMFNDDEVVMQLHPKESEYVNNHAHVLHLWRPRAGHGKIPTPPMWMV